MKWFDMRENEDGDEGRRHPESRAHSACSPTTIFPPFTTAETRFAPNR
jgi:hypothetical protein